MSPYSTVLAPSMRKFTLLRQVIQQPWISLTWITQANFNRLLDVARETYKENVGDIYMLNSALSDTHGLPLSLVYQESGFVFSLKKTDLEGAGVGAQLPKGFINPTVKKGKWLFSSMDLVSTTNATHCRTGLNFWGDRKR